MQYDHALARHLGITLRDDDTQPLDMTPLLRDPACVSCGMGTSRYGQCLDCEQCHNEGRCG